MQNRISAAQKIVGVLRNRNKYIMKKKTRSILEELNTIGRTRNSMLVIENRGANIIDSAINLLNLVRENYTPDEAMELERRFLNAIRTSEPRKFKRGLSKIHESYKSSSNED